MAGEVIVASGESLWRRRLVNPVMTQLRQGISVERISWTIAFGIVLGVFPVMGTTTLLCALVAWVLKLNQPIMHAFNWLVYPLHLTSILVFIRLGERLHGVPPISFSIAQLVAEFQADPLRFVREFGLAAWHGVTAWLLMAPVAIWLIKLLLKPLLSRLEVSLKQQKGVES